MNLALFMTLLSFNEGGFKSEAQRLVNELKLRACETYAASPSSFTPTRGRGAQYPIAFLKEWSGTLVRDEYKAYESVVTLHDRQAAGCLAHARRKYDELLKDNQSPVAEQAIQRIAWIYRVERELQNLTAEERLAERQARAKPLWEALFAWLTLERHRVPDGSGTAKALDYSLNH